MTQRVEPDAQDERANPSEDLCVSVRLQPLAGTRLTPTLTSMGKSDALIATRVGASAALDCRASVRVSARREAAIHHELNVPA